MKGSHYIRDRIMISLSSECGSRVGREWRRRTSKVLIYPRLGSIDL